MIALRLLSLFFLAAINLQGKGKLWQLLSLKIVMHGGEVERNAYQLSHEGFFIRPVQCSIRYSDHTRKKRDYSDREIQAWFCLKSWSSIRLTCELRDKLQLDLQWRKGKSRLTSSMQWWPPAICSHPVVCSPSLSAPQLTFYPPGAQVTDWSADSISLTIRV